MRRRQRRIRDDSDDGDDGDDDSDLSSGSISGDDDGSDSSSIFSDGPGPGSSARTSPDNECADLSDADLNNLLAYESSDNNESPEYYRKQRDQANKEGPPPPNYADSTKSGIARLEAQWTQYCGFIGRDPRFDEDLDFGTIQSFFDWKLNQKKSPKGRRLPGYRQGDSLKQSWRVFKQVYRKATGKPLRSEVQEAMQSVLATLAERHRLEHNRRPNQQADHRDAEAASQSMLCDKGMPFKLGRQRLAACLHLQLALITGSRSRAICKLRYRDLLVSRERDDDPNAVEPIRTVLQFTLKFTKSLLGPKATNKFSVPDLLVEPTLSLNVHAFLLGILLSDKAFEKSQGITRAHDLDRLDIPEWRRHQQVPLDSEKLDHYIFCRVVRTMNGYALDPTQPMDTSTVGGWYRKVGLLTGLLHLCPRAFRYGMGNALNKDKNVTEAAQNLIMDHQNIRTFLNHYQSRLIGVDTQAIARGMEPQAKFMEALGRMMRWIDPNRPKELTPQEMRELDKDDPEIHSKIKRRDQLGRRLRGQGLGSDQKDEISKKCRHLTSEIRKRRAQAGRAKLRQIRDTWDRDQAIRNNQRCLAELGFEGAVKEKLRLERLTPEHKHLVQSILSSPAESVEAERHRRNVAIDAAAAYCTVMEPVPVKRTPTHSTELAEMPRKPPSKQIDAAMESVLLDERPRICFICVGNKELPIQRRVYQFYRSTDLSKHFKRAHLQHITADQPLECRVCDLTLSGRDHLRNHAHTVHGTVS